MPVQFVASAEIAAYRGVLPYGTEYDDPWEPGFTVFWSNRWEGFVDSGNKAEFLVEIGKLF